MNLAEQEEGGERKTKGEGPGEKKQSEKGRRQAKLGDGGDLEERGQQKLKGRKFVESYAMGTPSALLRCHHSCCLFLLGSENANGSSFS